MIEGLIKKMFVHMGRKSGLLPALFVLALVSVAVLSPASQAAQEKRILVVHSQNPGYKLADELTRGIAADLRGEGASVKVHHEYMGLDSAEDPSDLQPFHDLYKHKFAKTHFDVIITTGNGAYKFIKMYRDDLFPETPVVFCGVEGIDKSRLPDAKLVTGVNDAVDIKATLDLALMLHPQTRRVVIINDATDIGRARHALIAKTTQAYKDGIAFVFLEDLDMPELLESVSKLGPNSLVLFSRFAFDKSGRSFEDGEAIAMIAGKCRVPIYGLSDRDLGSGIVGGMLTSGYQQGETASRMAVLILHGEKVSNLPVILASPNRYMFDYKQIERFKIDLSALPEGSIFVNRPSDVYSISRLAVRETAGVLAAALLMIMVLLYKLVKKQDMVRDLQASVTKYQAIADNTYNWEFWLSPEGHFLYNSPSCQRITGYTAEEFYADPGLLQRIVHPDDRALLEDHRHDSTWKLGIGELKFRIVHRKGDVRRIQHFCQPVFDDTGKFLGSRGSNTDISERKLI